MTDLRVIVIVAIAMFASACTRPDQAATQAIDSPAATSAPSIDPRAVAIAKALLLQNQSGAIDRTKLSQRLSSQLPPAAVRGVAKILASYGKLTGFTLLRSRTATSRLIHTPLTYDTFLATFEKQKITWWVAFDGDGKVEGMLIDSYVEPMSEQQLVPALQARLEHDAKSGRFSGAALLARYGKPIFEKAYGLADRAKGVPNTLETRFRIGSMNKMFTAVAIMQLVQAGKIDLNAALGKYVTDYPNKDVAARVTIHDLLTHTGGTGDIFGPEFDSHRLQLRTLDDYVALYGKRGLSFSPGSKWEYSNYGYILLGIVIERISGENYYDYVREHVYEPAGMTSSGSEPEDQPVPNRSIGYTSVNGKLQPNTNALSYRASSAGGGYSTVGDLLRFANALQNDVLLDAAHTQLLTTGKVDMPSFPTSPRRYAYGFGDEEINGVRCFGHDGGAPGMNGDLAICPGPGFVVAVLANMDPRAAEDVSTFVTERLPPK